MRRSSRTDEQVCLTGYKRHQSTLRQFMDDSRDEQAWATNTTVLLRLSSFHPAMAVHLAPHPTRAAVHSSIQASDEKKACRRAACGKRCLLLLLVLGLDDLLHNLLLLNEKGTDDAVEPDR